MSEEAPATPAGAGQTRRGDRASKPQPVAEPGLWLVATPIGNLEDISRRALAVLASVDSVACEDTRRTGRLLARHGISARLVSYHEHNAARVRPALIRTLAGGGSVALVSDAGTPLISDPGFKLVREAHDAGVRVTGCPGPSAPLFALILSGLPTDRFYFGGFLPSKAGARREALVSLRFLDATLVFFESPRRLAASLDDMATTLGSRPAAVARELTKLHEELRRGTLDQLAGHYASAGAPKGEVVVVVGGERSAAVESALSDADIDARLDSLLADGTVRDAAATLSAETGLPRRELYARALARAKEREECAVDP
ncbi:MAG: 16S rRNA (cytidine(1402)-2'-O)-methyltransferase [Rhodospirillales bacterium]|nr:16S rRNA (cytidine(1402)-2'-O)-methyltransferase [Rhodospirillales bacterium]